MKKEIDRNGRILYKFSHSVAQGGFVYFHKTISGRIIENKQGLRNLLAAISKKYKLIDATIKIYDSIFFFFFQAPISLAPAKIPECICNNISSITNWDKEYIFTEVYDLQEKFIKKDLKKRGYDYEKGYSGN